jgi:hypothetical protein
VVLAADRVGLREPASDLIIELIGGGDSKNVDGHGGGDLHDPTPAAAGDTVGLLALRHAPAYRPVRIV